MKTGLLITIDGPGGAGKTTLTRALAAHLATAGLPVVATNEPSPGPAGQLARQHLDRFRGAALACLVAADRYDHLAQVVRPALNNGKIVICDRYVPSSLVLQALDGCDIEFVYGLNLLADPPDLAIILTADPTTLHSRVTERGSHGRFSDQPGINQAEAIRYDQVAHLLGGLNIPTLRLDSTDSDTETLVTQVMTTLTPLSSRLHP